MPNGSQLRITAWPGGRVEPQPVLVQPCEQDGEWLVYPFSTQLRLHPVPDQAYLFELADVDSDDPAALAALSGRLGRFTDTHDLASDLPMNSEIAVLRAAAIREQTYSRRNLPEDSPSQRVHMAEVAYRLRVLRALTRHALAYRRGESVITAWSDALRPIETEAAAWDVFTDYVNPALRPFHVRVWAIDPAQGGLPIGQTWPTVYEVAVLQLVNDLVTDAEYRICAAEGCGRVFARQRGSGQYYSRTSGVAFCTPSCKNAQGQREWRRRRRVERERQDG